MVIFWSNKYIQLPGNIIVWTYVPLRPPVPGIIPLDILSVDRGNVDILSDHSEILELNHTNSGVTELVLDDTKAVSISVV